MLLVLVLATSPAASAQSGGHSTDPLASIVDADPMALARAVDRIGDAEVLARLEASRPRSVRVAAMRATPFMDGPEAAFATLAELAGGRDPWLAPEAARALLEATEGLGVDGLARREANLEALARVSEALEAVAADETARDDVRAACGLAAGRLRALGPPTSTHERDP